MIVIFVFDSELFCHGYSVCIWLKYWSNKKHHSFILVKAETRHAASSQTRGRCAALLYPWLIISKTLGVTNTFTAVDVGSQSGEQRKYPPQLEDVYTTGPNPNISTRSQPKHCVMVAWVRFPIG